MPRLLLVSEGPTDIGSEGAQPGTQDDMGALERLGALRVLLDRLLTSEVRGTKFEIETAPLARLHRRFEETEPAARGYPAKIAQAIRFGAARSCDAVAVVVDRDRDRERLKSLKRGLDLAERQHVPLRYATVVGVAIEALEAWLLADESALNASLLPDPPATFCNPESLAGKPSSGRHPKDLWRDLVGRARRSVSKPHEDVARHIDLARLEDVCSQGFGDFVRDFRECIRNCRCT